MSWRCQNCDYLGELVIETEEYTDGCPECKGYCIEFDDMTEEQEQILINFLEDNKESLLVPDNKKINKEIDLHSQLLWEDFIKAHEISNMPGIFSYTIVECEDEEAWLIDGWHLCNRIGYYFSTKKIDIPEEGIRYW